MLILSCNNSVKNTKGKCVKPSAIHRRWWWWDLFSSHFPGQPV